MYLYFWCTFLLNRELTVHRRVLCPLLLRLLQVRTTAAVTRACAGVADNVLPQSGSVTINFRLLPGDTPETALQLTRGWLGR
jgi:acetylornithine deacetylase/succinyl-diaminopimelate desuccinylase-like protein